MVKFGVKSDKGMVRETNEDCYNVIAGYTGVPVSFIIADGMGGHNSGEVASRMAVEYAGDCILKSPESLLSEENISDSIQDIIMQANTKIFSKAGESESNFGMGTTLIITVVLNKKVYIGHVGDSRVYLIRNGNMERLTIDHSFIEELMRNGSLSREEARNHPNKNVITRAVGCSENVEVDIYIYELKENDIILMCTDGLTNMVSEDEILSIVQQVEEPEIACHELVEKANERGGEDNITVILVHNI